MDLTVVAIILALAVVSFVLGYQFAKG